MPARDSGIATAPRDELRALGSAIRTALIALAIVAGVGFRFYNLSAHGFWGDEGMTALHTAGYTAADVVAALSQAQPAPAAMAQRFRTVGDRTVIDTVRALASEDPQHPPAYYVLARLWEGIAGSSVTSLRLFSALCSLLLLPAVYWLCMELFAERRTAWTAVALAAISPFNVEYAQQAREYWLWMVLTATASALLLRALRRGGAGWWIGYAAAMALGLYTHIFFGLVAVAHVAYVAGIALRREPVKVAPFLGALAAAAAVAVPWYLVLRAYTLHSGTHPFPAQNLFASAYAWLVALGIPFVDLEFISVHYFVVVVAVVALEAVALVLMIRQAPFAQWWFVLTLGASALALQIGNTGLTDMPRYLVPTILALQIAVAWLLGSPSERARNWPAASAIALPALACLVLFDLADDGVRAGRSVWWTNVYGEPLAAVAQRIDAGRGHPLVVGQPADWEALTDLAAELNPADRVWLRSDASSFARACARARGIYLFSRFTSLRDAVGSRVALKPVPMVFPVHGYGLLQAARGRGPAEQSLTWLWRVESSPAKGCTCSAERPSNRDYGLQGNRVIRRWRNVPK
jgi:Dolichyl-phosphate-mannose-protein mannosyltransferase